MTETVKTIAILLTLLTMAGMTMAGDIVVSAKAMPSVVEAGTPFEFQVSVSGSGSVPNPKVDIPNDFRILSGPNTSQSFTMVNMKMTASKTLSWRLVCTTPGSYTFPRATVDKDGKTYRSPKVTVEITPSGARSSSSSGRSSRSTPSSRTPQSKINNTEPIFIQVDVSERKPYSQEPVTVTYTLFFRENVQRFEINSYPSTEGFWTERLEISNPPEVVRRNVNGDLYSAAVIYQFLAFPTRSGELKIGPMDVTLDVVEQRRRRSRSLFDSFFDSNPFSNVVKRTVTAPSRALDVQPLPTANRPADFDGVVGDLDISAKLDRDTVMTNESVTLEVTVRGKGNIGFVPEPTLVIPPDIEKYEPKVSETSRPSGGTLSGSKTFTYLLIPRRAGDQKINPVRLSFFDPERKAYFTRTTKAMDLHVKPASGWAAQDVDLPHGSPEEVRSLGTDIRWILDATRGLRRMGTPLHQQAAYPAFYALPVAIALLSLWLRRRQAKLAGDVAGRRSRKAAKRAMGALKEARDQHGKGNIAEGYDALARGIVQYLADRVHVNPADLDRQRIDLILAERSVTAENRTELMQLLDKCDMARFTPGGLDETALSDLIERARKWILAVDRRFDVKRPR